MAKEIAEGYKEMKTRMLALLTVLGLVVTACGGSTESPSASVDAGKGDYKACLSLDTGGPADKNFNQSAYEGLLALEAEGFQIAYTTAVDDSSYAPNIQQLIDQGCNTVIAVGYNQGTALQEKVLAPENAEIAFGWVDANARRSASVDKGTGGRMEVGVVAMKWRYPRALVLIRSIAKKFHDRAAPCHGSRAEK